MCLLTEGGRSWIIPGVKTVEQASAAAMIALLLENWSLRSQYVLFGFREGCCDEELLQVQQLVLGWDSCIHRV